MLIYLAGDGNSVWQLNNFYDFHRLDSYLSVRKNKNFFHEVHRYKSFILDSGCFTFLKNKAKANIDWEKYVHEYADFVKKNQIKYYVQVDVDTIIGLDLVEKLTVRLEKLVGYQCMPVWHMNRGYDKWLEICKDYKYICFGAFLTDNLKMSNYGKVNKFIYDARIQGTRVHGLGMTSRIWLPKLNFYSVDSSSWTFGARAGTLYKFENNEIKTFTDKPNGKRMSKNGWLALGWHNMKEWIKYQKYMETK